MTTAVTWHPTGGDKSRTCDKCRDRFLGDLLLQAEVRYEGAIHGEKAAERLLNERLEPFHEDHS